MSSADVPQPNQKRGRPECEGRNTQREECAGRDGVAPRALRQRSLTTKQLGCGIAEWEDEGGLASQAGEPEGDPGLLGGATVPP